MTFSISVDFSGFDIELDKKETRKILRKVGAKTATRVRKRTKKAIEALIDTGEMVSAIRFKLDKRENGGAIFPGGPRKDRPGLTNWALAKFHSGAGRKVLHFEDIDREFFREQVELEINALGERILAKEGTSRE